MRQLSGLDAAFLALDTPTSTGHVGGVHVIEGTTDGATDGSGDGGGAELDLDRLLALVRSRLHLVPPMRRRVVEVPLGLDAPYWIEDPHFDLEYHVRELALPTPGNERQVTEQVARIHSRRLDRSRPLWEMYLIHGLEGGRKAVYTKLHHAMIDGVAAQEITAALLDVVPEGRELPDPPDWVPDAVPGTAELLARSAASVVTRPRRVVGVALDLARSSGSIARTVVGPRIPLLDRVFEQATSRNGASSDGLVDARDDATEGSPSVLFRTPVRAPGTPFNASVSPHRRFAMASVSLDDVKAVKKSIGLTVNDVVMAMCAGALRRWLAERDALPRGPLVAAVPVSVRSRTGKGEAFGNHVSVMLATLPTHLEDPAERLAVAHEATRRAKDQHDAIPAGLFGEMYSATLPALFGLAARANARLRVLERVNLFNLIISNVPGPNRPLFLAGCRVVGSFPVSAITDGQGLNITCVSYLDRLNFGLTADRELVPDADALAGYLADELAVLVEQFT